MITLSNIFSREKTLFYFAMWDDSDRLGYQQFLDYEVKNNLFIIPQTGRKGSVWYSQAELDKIDHIFQSKLLDKDFESEIMITLDKNWDKIKPYLVEEKNINSVDELSDYYRALVVWWSAMNTVLGVPDNNFAPADFKQKILSYRIESEKYTERMNKVFIEFWNAKAPQFNDLVSVLQPKEAIDIIKGNMSQDQIELIRQRREGCFMYNQKVYLLCDLDKILEKNGIDLEKVDIDGIREIKGRSAQQGKAIGPVKIIRVKTDAITISEGDILVTEMTSPEYVPYMKIAGAIVTDEGGATCHAAIASRELKIPCIVGTKTATKVLKDGDMVEVDTGKGTITILSK